MPIKSDGTVTGWELFGRRGIRQGDWKAVLLEPPEGIGTWQLYNLANDPGEIYDRSSEYPSKLGELVRAWAEYAEETGVLPETSR